MPCSFAYVLDGTPRVGEGGRGRASSVGLYEGLKHSTATHLKAGDIDSCIRLLRSGRPLASISPIQPERR